MTTVFLPAAHKSPACIRIGDLPDIPPAHVDDPLIERLGRQLGQQLVDAAAAAPTHDESVENIAEVLADIRRIKPEYVDDALIGLASILESRLRLGKGDIQYLCDFLEDA